MREELEMWKARFHKEAARSDELAADNAQLQSELAALRASKDAARSDELTARNTQLQAELMAARLEVISFVASSPRHWNTSDFLQAMLYVGPDSFLCRSAQLG